jgi:hypothetical protein
MWKALNKHNKFEFMFDDFVREFGGEKLSTAENLGTADYLFRSHNVVAELKCLQEDQSRATNLKLAEVIQDWYTKHNQLPPGCSKNGEGLMMRIVDAPSVIRGQWVKILSNPIENLLRKAHQQIRGSKARLGLPSARGVVLIFNEANQLHSRPQDFARLAGEIIQKPQSKFDASRRFPNIHGMVYFSADTVTTVDEITGRSMPFWGPFQVAGSDAQDVLRFQSQLRDGWYQYVSMRTGRSVVRHKRKMKWP